MGPVHRVTLGRRRARRMPIQGQHDMSIQDAGPSNSPPCSKTLTKYAITCTSLFFYSVLRTFQDYFSSYVTGQSAGGRKRENPEKNHLAHPQAELGLSHMWPVRGSNLHQTQR